VKILFDEEPHQLFRRSMKVVVDGDAIRPFSADWSSATPEAQLTSVDSPKAAINRQAESAISSGSRDR
jgi:hypothetical protein